MDSNFKVICLCILSILELTWAERTETLIGFSGTPATCGGTNVVNHDDVVTFSEYISSGGKSELYPKRFTDPRANRLQRSFGSNFPQSREAFDSLPPRQVFSPPANRPFPTPLNLPRDSDSDENYSGFRDSYELRSTPGYPEFKNVYGNLHAGKNRPDFKTFNFDSMSGSRFPFTSRPNPFRKDSDEDSFANHMSKKFTNTLNGLRPRNLPNKLPSQIYRLKSKPVPERKHDMMELLKKSGGTASRPIDISKDEYYKRMRDSGDMDEAPREPHLDPNSKLPPFVQHMLNKAKAAAAANQPKSDNNHGYPKNLEEGPVNPQDIFGSLTPEKLAQLKQLLNAASGPYGNGGMDSRDMIQQARRRVRRSYDSRFPMERLADQYPIREGNEGHRQSCKWTFKKGTNCNKLSVKMHYWIDGVRDCNLEYLQVSGSKITEKLCGPNDHLRQFAIEGDTVTVEHFRNTPAGKTKFKGTVQCE